MGEQIHPSSTLDFLFHPRLPSPFRTDSMVSCPAPFLLSISVFIFQFFPFFWFQFLVLCGRLSWHLSAFERTLKQSYHSFIPNITVLVRNTIVCNLYAYISTGHCNSQLYRLRPEAPLHKVGLYNSIQSISMTGPRPTIVLSKPLYLCRIGGVISAKHRQVGR